MYLSFPPCFHHRIFSFLSLSISLGACSMLEFSFLIKSTTLLIFSSSPFEDSWSFSLDLRSYRFHFLDEFLSFLLHLRLSLPFSAGDGLHRVSFLLPHFFGPLLSPASDGVLFFFHPRVPLSVGERFTLSCRITSWPSGGPFFPLFPLKPRDIFAAGSFLFQLNASGGAVFSLSCSLFPLILNAFCPRFLYCEQLDFLSFL